MRRVTLDDLLSASAGLKGVRRQEWVGAVVGWCEAAHLADCVRKRLGARAAARFGPWHLGGRAECTDGSVFDVEACGRLTAVLKGLQRWRDRLE